MAAAGDPAATELFGFSLGSTTPTSVADQGITIDGLTIQNAGSVFGLSDTLSLYSVDRSGAAPTLLGSTGLSSVGTAGLALAPDGTLFAAVDDTLYSLDTGSGTPTSIGVIGAGPFLANGISGLALVPAPGAGAAAGMALLSLASLRALAPYSGSRTCRKPSGSHMERRSIT